MRLEWQYKNYEVRTTDYVGGEPYVELFKHREGNGYYTIGHFEKDLNGHYELVFSGDKPIMDLGDMDVSGIWKQLYAVKALLELSDENVNLKT